MRNAERYLLGIDIGTSSTKVILCSLRGKVLGEASESYPLVSPHPGWNEQDPLVWWKATHTATRRLCHAKGLRKDSIAGIGLSGQMHGSVFLDEKNRPIRRALLWNDQRTTDECEEIRRRVGGVGALLRLVNNPALTGFTAPKILWLRNHEPRNYEKLRKIILPKDYVRWRMTGEHATDVADASGTLLLDISRRVWSTELLSKLGIDSALLPPLLESTDVAGKLTKEAARELGLEPGISVVAGAGDQPAGAVGMGIVREGTVSATIGTSGVVFAHSDKVVPNPKGVLQSFCHAIPEKWCVFGCMLSAGGAFDWLSQTLYLPQRGGNSFDVMTRAAQKVAPGSGGLIFLPYLDGERCPYPDPNSRGCWIGLNRHHDLKAMTRATMEGITFGMADQILMMRELGVKIGEVRCAGGGARSDFWRQLQADNYDSPTFVVETTNASALGAAILAGVGVGNWSTVEEACDASIKPRGKKTPKAQTSGFYRRQHAVYRDLYPALKDSFRKLAENSH